VTFSLGRPVAMALAEQACDYTYLYESLMGDDRVEFINDHAKKRKALELLMDHVLSPGHDHFSDIQVHATAVFRLIITSINGKSARKAQHEKHLPPILY
jgi:uncharacterized protein